MLPKLIRIILRFFFFALVRLELIGLEDTPLEGGYLYCINHLGIVDGPLAYALLERDDLSALVAYKHHKNPLFRWLVEGVNAIWIRRGELDVSSLRAARDFLRAGGGLGIAPEGTRSRSGVMMEAKSGVAYLADKVQVLPMGMRSQLPAKPPRTIW